MLKDITLGQYFPGNSLAHKLDPRTKILLTVVYIVALFCAKFFFSYGVVALLLITGIKISGVAPKALVRGLKPILFIICFTAILNLFYTPGEALVSFWIFKITKEGVLTAFFMVLRITMLIMGTFLLTYTTSPIALTDGLETLLNPLKKIRVPVHELAMIMSIALRMIPTLIEETDKIMSAQRARGADFESGNLLQRAKALVPIHGVPLLPWRRGKNKTACPPLSDARLSCFPCLYRRTGRSAGTGAFWLVIILSGGPPLALKGTDDEEYSVSPYV